MPLVAVVMGSKSDTEVMQPTLAVLQELGIDYEVNVISAHRTPEKARQYGQSAEGRGIEVIIAAAGAAAHLPGVLASWTTLPVVGVPLPGSALAGVDALYSIVQMPGGIPVACMAIGTAGAKNAAYFAAEILGLKYDKIQKAYEKYRNELQGVQGDSILLIDLAARMGINPTYLRTFLRLTRPRPAKCKGKRWGPFSPDEANEIEKEYKQGKALQGEG